MSTQPSPSTRISFGPFDFDRTSGELRKSRTRLRLQGQPREILIILLDHSGDVVSRAELQRRLWPGAVSGDFEHGLNAAINKLRQTLGDSAERPRYVETIPGRGYRWIAPVQPVARPLLEVPRSMPVEPLPVRQRSFGVVAGAALLAMFVIGSAGFYYFLREPATPEGSVLSFTIAPPPGFYLEGAGARQSFAISPSGSRIVFSAADDTSIFRFFVRDLRNPEPREVPESFGANSVFWRPDGSSFVFTAAGKLRQAPASAQTSQVLGDAIPGLLAGMWISPDRLYVSTRLSAASLPAFGGAPRAEQNIYHWPQLLPDGESILHVIFDESIGRYRAHVSRLGEKPLAQDLLEADSKVVYAPPGYLLYVRAGTLLAHRFDTESLSLTGDPSPLARSVCSFWPTAAADFSVSNDGVLVYQQCIPRSQLVWVDRTGRRLGDASPTGLALKAARLSPDRRRVGTSVYDVDRGITEVWLFDENGSGGRRMAGRGLSHSPVWSPDGKRLVLSRAYEARPRLFLRSLEGEEREEALPSADFQVATDWSSDGRFIVYNNTGQPLVANEQHGDIWVMDMERGRSLIPLVRTPHHEANAAFSPDGKWLAFTSNDSGRAEVYVQALQTGDSIAVRGERHLVSRHGAICLRWRTDGRELFYLGADGVVHGVPVNLSAGASIGTPIPLFKIGAETRAAIHALLGFDVSANGKRFVIPVVNSPEKPSLVVVQNWTAALGSRPI